MEEIDGINGDGESIDSDHIDYTSLEAYVRFSGNLIFISTSSVPV